MQASTHEHGSAESWITSCPQCSTAFRITRQHLMAAKGAVRCGSCLHVFSASSFIVGGTLPEELKFQPAPQKPQPQSQPEATHNSLDFSEDALAIDSSKNSSSYSSSEAESDTYEEDEAWARAMLEEMELDEDEDHEEIESASEQVFEPAPAPTKPQPQPQKSISPKQKAKTKEKPRAEKKTAKPEPKQEAKAKPKPASTLSSLNSDPLDLSYRKQSLWQKLLWPAACALAFMALILQYGWANFANISKDPSLRPLATKVCNLLPCQLPEQRDITKIQVSHIVIRPDRNYQNALTIDAIITNEASFKQAYPSLMMTFFGMEEGIIGQRVLTPDQYLSGEAAGALDMPVRQPIHLAISVINPSKKLHSVDLSFTHP
ncbi:zinc-ribbon and DUF3426 domain-containing protein [Sansalvadorimonas verongulae]|uniref:zinc-ribbon and DUF3426 domain-containing protein n=1 Tax=Sansalvadorimonas verongulae TaxID=2172824 RepID=UPI0012BCF50E|nr:zinc-ribbon and DUF3426 domain-containing protein [Sansalvadorimonas verongulae]MTI14139.1 DUF3426 domain-containing protein [Sansalvadorimonas verongulae]